MADATAPAFARPTVGLLRGLGFRRARGPARRVLLVCSPGGHLQQLLALEEAWAGLEESWVTLPGSDVADLLAGHAVELAHGPTNRDLGMLLLNLRVAWRVIRRRDPDVILSTGAGIAVPFFWIGRLLGRRCVYLESLTRVNSLSLSGRLVYPVADEFMVQWRGAQRLRRSHHVGTIL
jgi:beta-1,4-N-acetylglucosaminyltransferase